MLVYRFRFRLHEQPCSSKLKKLPSLGNYPATSPLPCANLRRMYRKVAIGARAISKGFGQEDRGELDDNCQLGEGEDKADGVEYTEN